MYNPTKLDAELQAAGLPVLMCSTDAPPVFKRDLTTEEQAQADDILAAHDPHDYSISPDSAVIVADGQSAAVFVVTGNPADTSVNVLVAGQVEVIGMTDGRGEFEVVSEQTGVIVVTGESGPLAQQVAKVYAAAAVVPPGAPIL